MWTVEVSGHMNVVFVLVPASSGCHGRNVRWTPRTWSQGCAEVSPESATASW